MIALAAALIGLGVVSLRQMHADVLPELAGGPVLEVQTEALGLSSQEVEQYLTVPMENNLLDGVMGVWDLRSRSTPGLSTIDLYFEPGTTVLHARQLVEERLTNAFSLPNVAKPPLLIQPLSSSSRALLIGLSSTSIAPLELSYLARWVVKPRLSGVTGVANVSIFGQQDFQIQVQVDPTRLAAHHITLEQVIDTAGNAQLVSPLSYLQGSAPGTGGFLDQPNQRLDIRPVLPLGTPKDLASVPVTGASGGPTLGDVATLVESHQPLIGDALSGRGTQLVLLVQKLPGASLVGVTNGVEQALRQLAPALRGVRIDTSFFRPATYLEGSFHDLALILVVAAVLGLLALVALFLEARALLISALSVGLSVVLALLVLGALGYTLNALVVLGLLVASGVLVDDAVAGAHAVAIRLRARAADGAEVPTHAAILEACRELRSTLAFATAIVLLAVAPVFFARGLTATYLHPMVLAYALAVIASAVVALTFAPALALLLFARSRSAPRRPGLREAIAARYERVVRAALRVPRGALALVLIAGLAAFIALPFLEPPAPPTFKDRNLVVTWDGPAGASLGEMDRISQLMLGSLRRLPAVADVAATLGRAVAGDQIADASSGQLYVAIRQSADYDGALAAVRATVGSVPGIQASVSTYEADVQAGVLAAASHDLTVRVYGEDYGQDAALARKVRALMLGIHGVGSPQIALPAVQPDIEVSLNDARAHDAGVLPGDARRQASTLVSGLTVGNFFENQAVFDVVVIGTPAVRANISTIRGLLIDTDGGGHVPLSSIASIAVRADPIDIQHDALARFVDVTAQVQGSIGAVRAAIQRKLPSIGFPLTYHAEVLGATPDDPTAHLKFMSFVLAATIGLVLLLQAALGSWRLAALLTLLAPVTLAGGLAVALVTGQAPTLGADAGLLGILAFAIRRGMLTTAHIRRLHGASGGALSAGVVVRAAREVFGSSLRSALVLAAVLMPFAIGGDIAGNELTHTAAQVMLGGLLSALLVTELLIPSMFLAFGPREPIVPEPDEEPIEPAGVASPTTGTV